MLFHADVDPRRGLAIHTLVMVYEGEIPYIGEREPKLLVKPWLQSVIRRAVWKAYIMVSDSVLGVFGFNPKQNVPLLLITTTTVLHCDAAGFSRGYRLHSTLWYCLAYSND